MRKLVLGRVQIDDDRVHVQAGLRDKVEVEKTIPRQFGRPEHAAGIGVGMLLGR